MQVYVRLTLRTSAAQDKVRVCEQDKCHEWSWRSVVEPNAHPMFNPLEALFKCDYWRQEVVHQELLPRTSSSTSSTLVRSILACGLTGVAIFTIARSSLLR